MALKRLITAAPLLGFALHLASCGSFVADHWPHWAGGLPVDAPPRPGTPGYADFIAHGQPIADKQEGKQEPAPAAAAVQIGTPQASVAPAPAAPAVPEAPVRAAAPDSATGPDSGVVKGGLY
jgi:hypothetical protein